MKLCEVSSVCAFLLCLWVVQETKASLEESKVNVTANRGNYSQAVNYCKKFDLKLIRINNDSDNSLVYGLAVNNSVGRYWIDGKWNLEYAKWVNLDNAALSYTKWDRVEPNNKTGLEFCVEGNFYSSEYWNDIDCIVENGIICYDDRDSLTTKKTIKYEVIKGLLTYEGAVAACKSYNGTLPRIESMEMMMTINGVAHVESYTDYWTDLTRVDGNSTWKYSDGTSATYIQMRDLDASYQCAFVSLLTTEIQTVNCNSEGAAICVILS